MLSKWSETKKSRILYDWYHWHQVQKLAISPEVMEVRIEVSFGRVRSLGERLGFWVAITTLFIDLGASYVSLVTLLKCIVCIICVFPSMNLNNVLYALSVCLLAWTSIKTKKCDKIGHLHCFSFSCCAEKQILLALLFSLWLLNCEHSRKLGQEAFTIPRTDSQPSFADSQKDLQGRSPWLEEKRKVEINVLQTVSQSNN